MKTSYLFLFVTVLSISAQSSESKNLDVSPSSGSWFYPAHESDTVSFEVKIGGDQNDVVLILRHNSKDYKFKKKPNKPFTLELNRRLIPNVGKFNAELVLFSAGKEISKTKLEYFCCAFANKGSFFSLVKGRPSTLEITASDSELRGLKLGIPGGNILENQNAVIGVTPNFFVDDKKYIPVSSGFFLKTSKEMSVKGISVSIPIDLNVPRMSDGLSISELKYLTMFGLNWKDIEKKEIILLAKFYNTIVEVKPKTATKDLMTFTLPGESDYSEFIVVSKRKSEGL